MVFPEVHLYKMLIIYTHWSQHRIFCLKASGEMVFAVIHLLQK